MVVHGLQTAPSISEPLRLIFLLYIGPDQILPLTSSLAAGLGVLMVFWRHVVGLAKRLWRFLLRR